MKRRSIIRHLLLTTSAIAIGTSLSAEAQAACTTVGGSGLTNPSGTTVLCVSLPSGSATGDINNQGTIADTGTSAVQAGVSIGAFATLTGAIRNSGTIQAISAPGGALTTATGIHINVAGTVTGAITNTGLITATAHTATAGAAIGIHQSATFFGGGISNSGTIQATNALVAIGIDVARSVFGETSSFGGGISNSGLLSVSGKNTGVGIFTEVSNYSGGVSNSGTITAAASGFAADGILVEGSTFTGGISNSGVLTINNSGVTGLHHGSGIFVAFEASFSGGIANSGTINVTLAGGEGVGIAVNNVSHFAGDITNSGPITVTGANFGAGLYIDNMDHFNTFESPGTIANSGSIGVTGGLSGFGIYVRNVNTIFGNIINSGSIGVVSTDKAGNAAYGIYVNNVTTFVGGISNSGTIGVTVSGAEGHVSGVAVGIAVTNIATRFVGDIGNSGSISASASDATGILASNVFSFVGGISNSGSIGISAGHSGHGIYLLNPTTVTDGISNSGTIGVSAGGNGYGILIENTTTRSFVTPSIGGGVSNSGLITVSGGGSGYGIFLHNLSRFSGNIDNAGTIEVSSVDFAAGIAIVSNRGSALPTTFGNIVNSGLITVSSGSSAYGVNVFRLATFFGNIQNSGTINVTATGGSPAIGVGVSTLAQFGARSSFAGGITNTGKIGVSAAASGYGIDLAGVTAIIGDVINSGTIDVTAGGFGAGIFVKHSNTFVGSIDNSGTISIGSLGTAAAYGIGAQSVHVWGQTSSFIGTVINSGTVAPAIDNSGLISVSAGGDGFGIGARSFYLLVGGIANSGMIDVTAGANGYGIDAEEFFIFFGNSFDVSITSVGGGIVNSGAIKVNAGASAYGINVRGFFGFAGNVVNSGTIDVTASNGDAYGINVGGNAPVAGINGGGIANSGTIALGAARFVADVTPFTPAPEGLFIGGVTNSGTILASAYGASHNAYGINLFRLISITGGVTNNGLIVGSAKSGTGIGVQVSSFIGSFAGGIANTGTILAAGSHGATGIAAYAIPIFNGGIVNSGSIVAMGGSAWGVFAGATSFNGGIVNSGSISATATGATGSAYGIEIEGTTFNGGIANTATGKIVALAQGTGKAYGVYIGAPIFNGGITNAGVIASGETTPGVPVGTPGNGIGIYSATAAIGSIVNTGTIMGSEYAIDLSSPGITGSTTIANSGALYGGLNLSDTVTDTVNNTGYVESNIFGAAAVYNQTAGELHILTGTSVGNPTGSPVPINTFNATGGEILFDITATPSDPLTTSHGGTQGNGFILAQNFTATDAVAYHVGLAPNQVYVPASAATFDTTTNAWKIDYHNILNGSVSFSGPTTPVLVTIDGGSLLLTAEILPDTPVLIGGPGAGADMLELSRKDFVNPSFGFLTPNETATAEGLDGLVNSPNGNSAAVGALIGLLLTTSDPNVYKEELTELSGFQQAAVLDTSFGAPVFTVDQVQTVVAMGPHDGNWVESASFSASGIQIASGGDVTTDAGQQTAQASSSGGSYGTGSTSGVYNPWTFWGRGYGVFGTATGQTEVPGYEERRGGGIFGADYQVTDDLLVGAVFNYANTDVTFHNAAGNTNLDTYLFGLYGQYRMGPIYFNLTGGGGFSNYTTDRNIFFLPTAEVAHSTYNGQTYFVYGESGYEWHCDRAKITPFIGLTYLHSHLDSFTETGAGAADLTNFGADRDSVQTSLGARVSTDVTVGGAVLVPEVRAVWEHEFADDRSTITNAFALAPSSPFTIQGIKFGRDAAVIGGGVAYDATNKVKLFIDYDAKLQDNYTGHAVTAGVRVNF